MISAMKCMHKEYTDEKEWNERAQSTKKVMKLFRNYSFRSKTWDENMKATKTDKNPKQIFISNFNLSINNSIYYSVLINLLNYTIHNWIWTFSFIFYLVLFHWKSYITFKHILFIKAQILYHYHTETLVFFF